VNDLMKYGLTMMGLGVLIYVLGVLFSLATDLPHPCIEPEHCTCEFVLPEVFE